MLLILSILLQLPFNLGAEQLRDFFRHAGHIMDYKVLSDKEGRSRGCGTVRFENSGDCERAVSILNITLHLT